MRPHPALTLARCLPRTGSRSPAGQTGAAWWRWRGWWWRAASQRRGRQSVCGPQRAPEAGQRSAVGECVILIWRGIPDCMEVDALATFTREEARLLLTRLAPCPCGPAGPTLHPHRTPLAALLFTAHLAARDSTHIPPNKQLTSRSAASPRPRASSRVRAPHTKTMSPRCWQHTAGQRASVRKPAFEPCCKGAQALLHCTRVQRPVQRAGSTKGGSLDTAPPSRLDTPAMPSPLNCILC